MANYSSTNTTSNTTSRTWASGEVSQNTQNNLSKYQQDYQESQKVQDAYNQLQNTLNNKPAEFQSSYTNQLNQLYDNIMNRKEFSYNMNADALYQQYKDQYQTAGKTAMKDTVAQASALTGGYANSYAQTAGQQTYQNYLTALNDKVPELYNIAYQKYKDEGDQMTNNFNLTKSMYDTQYGEYRDKVSDYQADRDYFSNQYNNERNFDYNQYSDNRNYWTQEYWNEKNSAQTTESTTTSNSITKSWSDEDPDAVETTSSGPQTTAEKKKLTQEETSWNQHIYDNELNALISKSAMPTSAKRDYINAMYNDGKIDYSTMKYWLSKL